MGNDEGVQGLMYYGRWIPQDFVTRGHDPEDVIYYLRAEREFEILKLTSFVTTNLVSFERIKTSRVKPHSFLQNDIMGSVSPADNQE